MQVKLRGIELVWVYSHRSLSKGRI